MNTLLFVKNFIKSWREVGSVAPSSHFLTEKMLESIDFSKLELVVELGPGTGAFTREILKRLKPSARFIAVETNQAFCKNLREIQDKRFTLVEDSAENLSSILKGAKADAIVSGIPLAVLPQSVKETILNEVKLNLKKTGVYTQFQYFLQTYGLVKKVFPRMEISFTPFNTPPAFIYTCRL